MLQHDNMVPLYQQLRDRLRQDIMHKAYKPGDKLPSERKLAADNNISVVTARNALLELEEEGLIERIQGKGTFVSIKKYDRNLKEYESFTEMCKGMGAKAGAKELEKKIIKPNLKITNKLEVPEDSQVVYISRLRYVDDEPMVIEDNYFSLDYAYLLNEDLSDSLFKILYNKNRFEVSNSRKKIEIVRANEEESALLNLEIDSPIIKISSIAYLKDGSIGYLGFQLINGERFKLVL